MPHEYEKATIGWFALAYGVNLILVIILYILFFVKLDQIASPNVINVSWGEGIIVSIIFLIVAFVPKPSQVNPKFKKGNEIWLYRLLAFFPIIIIFFTT